jgi:AraC-like DNA-binding protein
LSLVSETVRRFAPELAIFEYDYPSQDGLEALQQAKLSFPSLPILMITDYHSEALAVWAFRSGVRDYLWSPVRAEELISRVERLTRLRVKAGTIRPRGNLLPPEPIEEKLFPWSNPGLCRTAAALEYIETHLREKITLKDAARRCGISPYRFSHLFRQEHGITFQEVLLRKRSKEAQRLLIDTGKSVTEVAYAVGFGDLSYFIRIFKRYVGRPPAAYRLLGAPSGAVSPGVAPEESTGQVRRSSAQMPTSECRLCDNWDCACWSGADPAEK